MRHETPLAGLLIACCLFSYVSATQVEQSTTPIQQPKTIADRAALRSLASWTDSELKLVVPGEEGGATRTAIVHAKTVYYTPGAFSVTLTLISDPQTKLTYIVNGEQEFYVSNQSGMLACLMGAGVFTMSSSIFEAATLPQVGDAEVLAHFVASIDDARLLDWRQNPIHIGVKSGVPNAFWTAHGGLDQQGATPTISAINIVNHVLQLDLIGGGGEYKGNVWIDLATRKLLRTIVDGKEVFRTP